MNKRNSHMIYLNRIEEEIYIESEKRAATLPVFENSHRKKEANQVGCLGEVIAEYWMRHHGIEFISQLNETTHDYLVNNELTIDVKTKDRTVRPRGFYDNSAPLYNHDHQRPDYFLFISLERDKNNKSKNIKRYHSAYILGSISYGELDKVGIPFLKGEQDWRNYTKFWTDCLNVEMWQLIPIKETVQIFKGELKTPTENATVNRDIIIEMQKRIDNNELKPRKLPNLQ